MKTTFVADVCIFYICLSRIVRACVRACACVKERERAFVQTSTFLTFHLNMGRFANTSSSSLLPSSSSPSSSSLVGVGGESDWKVVKVFYAFALQS